jgi:ABC-2 type transport system permease protein
LNNLVDINWRWRWAALKNGFQDATAYRVEFLFEVLGSAAAPAAIQWVLWYALFNIGGATHVAGMSYTDLIQYTWISLLFTQIRGGDHDFELQEMIRSGGLSTYLLRPCSVIEFTWIRGVAPKLFLAGLGLVTGLAFSPWLGISPVNLLVAMGFAILGNIIHYQLGASIAATAFWWEEGYSILMVKNMLVGLLSGELVPLSLFPENLQWIWKSTPFYLYVFGPVQIAQGKWDTKEIFMHLGIAAAWLMVGWALIRITWGIGIRRYQSLGG